MKAILEIKSYDDFRKMSFSDFFYALKARDDKEAEASAKRIIAAVEPSFVPRILERRKAVILLRAIRTVVAGSREEHLRSVRMREEKEEEERKRYERLDAISNMSGFSFIGSLNMQVRQLKELQDRTETAFSPVDTVGIKLKHLGFEELLDLMKDDLMDGSFAHINALATIDDRCSSFLSSLDEEIRQQATVDANKALIGLYLLPLLEDDQELIIYFGTAFHATFENVDAYTGLLYASTYFDTEETYLKETFSSASEDERVSVIQEARNNRDFDRALKLIEEGSYDKAALAFEELGDFKNSRAMMKKALYARDMALKEESYGHALKLLEEEKYDDARAIFAELGDYRDSGEMNEKIAQICEEKNNSRLYEDAERALQEFRYADAEKIFLRLGEWRDAPEMADVACENYRSQQYEKANALMREGRYDKAIKIFSDLGDYEDSKKKLDKALFKIEEDRVRREQEEEARLSSLYVKGHQCLLSSRYEEAERVFSQIGGYRDAVQLKDKAHELAALERSYANAKKLLDEGDYARAAETFATLADYGKAGYKDSRKKAEKCRDAHRKQQVERYKEAERLMQSEEYKGAEAAYRDLSGYLDASERAKQASILLAATQALAAGNIEAARSILNTPDISCLSATKQIEEDLQLFEKLIKQEQEGGAELEKLIKERDSVNKHRADLRERASTPVPSQKEKSTSVYTAALIREALGRLGVFDFKAKRDLVEQLEREIARQNACSQRIPIEMAKRKKEIEEAEEALVARGFAVEEQIRLQKRLIADAKSRLSGIKNRYSRSE